MSKIKDVVSWIMEKEPLLKLKNANKTYDIKEDVYDVIKEKKLYEKEDFAVEVEIEEQTDSKDDEEVNGIITYLKEIDSANQDESKEETSKTTSDTKDNVIKELTVHGVSVAKKGVIFKEEEKVWYTLDDDINAQVFKDNQTGKMIQVTISPTTDGNDIITGYVVKEETTKEDDTKKETSQDKRKYNNTGNSIEAQASLKCAKVIVASMVTPDSKPEFVLKLITRIAEHSYKTIQDLKNEG